MTKPADRNVTTAPVVLIGVGGGIAAYKVVEVASALSQAGLAVHVAMTPAAQEFMTPLTFAAVTGHKVLLTLFPEEEPERREDLYPHLYPATQADLFLLAPATANLLSRVAQGKGDDIVTTSILSLPAHCRRFFCPSMNVEMWSNPIVQRNAARLEETGWIRIGPDRGALACGTEGEGRMSQPAEIIEAVRSAAETSRVLYGRTVLITSGPTHEHLDPVRFLGNPSSGKMGRALAIEAAACGASVDFVTGPVPEALLPRHPRIHVHRIVSAQEMLDTARPLYTRADAAIFAAAVADYRPRKRETSKRPRETKPFDLALEPTPDIAAELNQAPARPLTIGFALQSSDGEAAARRKLEAKHFDAVVLNYIESMGAESASFTFIPNDGESRTWGTLSKSACARNLMGYVTTRLDPGE